MYTLFFSIYFFSGNPHNLAAQNPTRLRTPPHAPHTPPTPPIAREKSTKKCTLSLRLRPNRARALAALTLPLALSLLLSLSLSVLLLPSSASHHLVATPRRDLEIAVVAHYRKDAAEVERCEGSRPPWQPRCRRSLVLDLE